LRFNGDQDGLSVDKFLYRVEALTRQTLNSRFDLLCGNASVLFEGKAREYYWRFHKVSDSSRWDLLTEALRKQFRDTRTDVDLRETIRDRKQKEKESFDAFYDAIVQITDCLEVPMAEKDLIETLRRNLRPEIRHELLNVTIDSVQKLRDICRRREGFLEDVKRTYGYQKPVPFRKQVSELVQGYLSDEASEFSDPDQVIEVDAIGLVCWNCRQEGHRYHDCKERRKIFCYGCGIPNTYKHTCPKCQKNAELNSRPRQQPCVLRNKPANSVVNQH